MKTQAWGWLATAVLAAGLNSSYHNGGLQWAHEIADRVQHNSNAVFALATGRADQFVAEAQILGARQSPSCPWNAVLAEVRQSIAPSHSEFDRFEAMSAGFSARQQVQLARLEANRARMEAQFARLNMANFHPVVVGVPKITCRRVHVSVPRVKIAPMRSLSIPSAPVVQVDYSGPGPV